MAPSWTLQSALPSILHPVRVFPSNRDSQPSRSPANPRHETNSPAMMEYFTTALQILRMGIFVQYGSRRNTVLWFRRQGQTRSSRFIGTGHAGQLTVQILGNSGTDHRMRKAG